MIPTMDNAICDVMIDSCILPFFKTYGYFSGFDFMVYSKEWERDKSVKLIYNTVHFVDKDDDFEITIGISKNYDGYYITINDEQHFVESKGRTLGEMYDNLGRDVNNLLDECQKIFNELNGE